MTSQYKGVRYSKKKTSSNAKKWFCQYKGVSRAFHTEREAAKDFDLLRIRDGLEPCNVLRRKES